MPQSEMQEQVKPSRFTVLTNEALTLCGDALANLYFNEGQKEHKQELIEISQEKTARGIW